MAPKIVLAFLVAACIQPMGTWCHDGFERVVSQAVALAGFHKMLTSIGYPPLPVGLEYGIPNRVNDCQYLRPVTANYRILC